MSNVINLLPPATAVEPARVRITGPALKSLRSGVSLLDVYGHVWFSKYARPGIVPSADVMVLVPEFATDREWSPSAAEEFYGPFFLLCDPDALGARS